jgi:ribosomal protein S18 acetylase RimI-like enzyme
MSIRVTVRIHHPEPVRPRNTVQDHRATIGPMSTIVLRPARTEDARGIAAVHVAGWQWGYRGLLDSEFLAGLSVDARVAVWVQDVGDPDIDVVVADHGHRIVGFASTSPSRDSDAPPRTGELVAIYIVEDVSGTGVGSALLEAAEDAMRRRGYRQATLWVLASNARARGFYERHGWRSDGTEKTEGRSVSLHEVRYLRVLDHNGGP